MQKICPYCGKEFETTLPFKVYCSRVHTKRAGEKRNRKQRLERKRQNNPEYNARFLEKKAARELERRTRNRKAECRKCGSPMPLVFGRGRQMICDTCRVGKKGKRHKNCTECGKELLKREKKYCRSCARKVFLEKNRENAKRYSKTEKGKEILRKHAARFFKTEKGLEIARNGFHKRKAKMKFLPCDLTADDWKKAIAYFGGKCVYCGTKGKLQQDHFVPVSKGGGYTRRNIVPACKSCNCSKHDHDPFAWLSTKPNGIEIYQNVVRYLEV